MEVCTSLLELPWGLMNMVVNGLGQITVKIDVDTHINVLM